MKTWKAGDFESSLLSITETANDIFGAMSKDKNPVHFDKERMANTHFKYPIANGIQCISAIGAAIVEMFTTDETMVIALEQHNSFLKPVYVGATIEATIMVEEVQPNSTYWLQCFVYGSSEKEEPSISCRFRVRVIEG